jgi:hypothetical protein
MTDGLDMGFIVATSGESRKRPRELVRSDFDSHQQLRKPRIDMNCGNLYAIR